jgi:asparagine synthase (glutamine-hydrolysing)
MLLDYLITGLEDCTSETFFEGIMKLPAGHNLVYDLERHTHQIRPFYEVQFDKATGKLPEAESVALYEERLTNSVTLRLRSDVKVGTCLSGGLDSSTVAALAAKLYTGEGKFQAIHAKSEELKTDESSYAQRVADHTGIELTIVEPDYEDFAAEIDAIIETQEEPFGSPSVAMQYFVLKKAREINCIVMLDGQGGDETLLGYERYYPAMIRTLPAYRKWKALRESYRNSKLTMKQTIAFMFYFGNYRVRLNRVKQRAQFLKKEYLTNFQSASLEQLATSYSDIRKLQKQEIRSTQLPHLLRYEDKNSMRHAVETRLPFIDYRVVETALSTNNAFKIKDGWTKYLLRKVISPLLPEEIVWRKNKFGFNAPEDIWLQKHLPVMEKTIRESVILNELIDWNRFHLHGLDLRMQWRLFNIAKWEQIFKVVLDKK